MNTPSSAPPDRRGMQLAFPLRLKEAVLATLQYPVFVWRQPDELIYWNQAAAPFIQAPVSTSALTPSQSPFQEIARWRLSQLSQLSGGRTVQHRFLWNKVAWQAIVRTIVIDDAPFDVLQLIPLSGAEQEALEAAEAMLEELRTQLHCNQMTQKRLEYLLRHDPLTDLLNRQGVLEKLEERVAARQTFTVLFVDLDGFKSVNDALGHQAGDRLLMQVGMRLKGCVGAEGEVARFAGDEFVVLLSTQSTVSRVSEMAERLLIEMSEPFELDEYHTVNISASIGIYRHQVHEGSVEDILARVDYAMYEAKRRGKNRYVMFDGELRQRMALHNRLQRELDAAFEERAFYIRIQPVYHTDGRLASGEVLVRWECDGEEIAPAVFIPLLERRGLIQKLTYHVLEDVVKVLKAHPHIPVLSVNLSLQLFYEEGFLDWLDALMKAHPDLRGRIAFEVPESIVGQEPQRIIPQLNRMHAMGFMLHIDNFGASYASLASIRELPAEALKIAPDFIAHIGDNDRDELLLDGMVALARRLNMRIVVEGVETERQRERLERLGEPVCLQGYGLGYPVSSQAFVKLAH